MDCRLREKMMASKLPCNPAAGTLRFGCDARSTAFCWRSIYHLQLESLVVLRYLRYSDLRQYCERSAEPMPRFDIV